jgi:phosphoribosyl 1,2-cyclic phosphate phosphodiesterase
MRTLYEGVDVLVIDALRRAPHPTHPTLDQAVAWAQELRAGGTLLTHMDQSMDYATLAAALPAGIAPAHDGQEVLV